MSRGGKRGKKKITHKISTEKTLTKKFAHAKFFNASGRSVRGGGKGLDKCQAFFYALGVLTEGTHPCLKKITPSCKARRYFF